ncbi:CGCGG family rSAM-modified RiPP protein [Natronomonas salina]|uniref:CGCGG family putative rSAM-modified RiPP protein n=1 Tax=Natronomonas salina TaxID=1710540 RepID=UPI0015B3F0F6|nr:CGCGG family rSAM-modified RiPP protein [Natronomonas salina]QLD89156.1 CGCGG family rSAM-modified RiPP protein [Natronomonas salina]
MAVNDADVQPVTDRTHDNSWSANLELPQYADDEALLVEHATDAIRRTTAGHHVNLVTHKVHGHPDEYLVDALEEEFDAVTLRYVEQCGCGGHVLRATL